VSVIACLATSSKCWINLVQILVSNCIILLFCCTQVLNTCFLIFYPCVQKVKIHHV
jgi:hypothetical protein